MDQEFRWYSMFERLNQNFMKIRISLGKQVWNPRQPDLLISKPYLPIYLKIRLCILSGLLPLPFSQDILLGK